MPALSPDAIMLSGRVAVVTGAASESGRAIAETLRALGAHLATCDRATPRHDPRPTPTDACRPTPLDGSRRGGVRPEPAGGLAMTVDVRDPVAAGVFARAVEERWGRVDVLVNAGPEARPVPLTELPERDGRRLVDEGFTRVTGMVRRLLPLMGAGTSIVNVVSGDGPVRALVESLTGSLAAELRPRGVRVNALVLETPEADPAGPALFLAGPLSAGVSGVTLRVRG
ncbi:SDR family NAD(P)-dependent oxidoreductase [Nonomuraea sp. NPDC003214]